MSLLHLLCLMVLQMPGVVTTLVPLQTITLSALLAPQLYSKNKVRTVKDLTGNALQTETI
jgi:hypothetical protein